MMAHQNQYLKNGYRLVKISNGKNSKKFATRINGYHFDKQGNSKVADLILRECRLDNKSNTFWPVF